MGGVVVVEREWTPWDYIDEISPPGRASPDAWIDKVSGGVATFAPVEDADDAFRITAKVGDLVAFTWAELHARIVTWITKDGYRLLAAAPAHFTRVCTNYSQGGFVDTTVEAIVKDIRDEFGPEAEAADDWPVEVELFFYVDNLNDPALNFRLVDKGGALAFMPEDQKQ